MKIRFPVVLQNINMNQFLQEFREIYHYALKSGLIHCLIHLAFELSNIFVSNLLTFSIFSVKLFSYPLGLAQFVD